MDDAEKRLLSGKGHSAVFWLSQPQVMAASGAWAPEATIAGEIVQDLLDATKLAEFLTFTALPTKKNGAFILSWVSPKIGEYVEEIINHDLCIDILFALGFETESISVAPHWWESLSTETQEQCQFMLVQIRRNEFDAALRLAPHGMEITKVERFKHQSWLDR